MKKIIFCLLVISSLSQAADFSVQFSPEDNSISTAKIQDGAVTDSKISSISSSKISDLNTVLNNYSLKTDAQKVAYLKDIKASGVAAGAAIAATQNVRVLNNKVDPDGIIPSFGSNQFSLNAGTYKIQVSAPAYGVNTHQIRLRNITDANDALVGNSSFAANAYGGMSHSMLMGVIQLNATKTFEIWHYTQTGVSVNGLGTAVGSGANEVYTQVEIIKIK